MSPRTKVQAAAVREEARASILGTGTKGEAALHFQIVIQAVTLERVPKQVTALILGLPIVLARQPGAIFPEPGTILRLFGI